MILRNFTHLIKRFKTASLLNIFGLALAFAVTYLIIIEVRYELSYNRNINNSKNIYTIQTYYDYYNRYIAAIPIPIGNAFCKNNPAIKNHTVYFGEAHYECYSKNENEDLIKNTFNGATFSPKWYETFDIKALEGDITLNDNPDCIAVTKSAAKRLNLKINDMLPTFDYMQVVAIIPDFPENSDFGKIEVVFTKESSNDNDFSEWSYMFYLLLNDNADIDNCLQTGLTSIKDLIYSTFSDEDLKSMSQDNELSVFENLRILNINDSYFAKDSQNISPNSKKGNLTTTISLIAIAVLIIAIAFINFINFFMSMVPQRIRSVSTYRIYGCTVAKMRLSFVMETVFITIISLILSVIIILLIKNSYIAELLPVSIALENNIVNFVIIALAGFIAAILASIYPSYYITSFPTTFTLKAGFAMSKSSNKLRYTLTIIQFIISIILIICSIFIKLQHEYMMNYDMGFNKEMVLCCDIPYQIGNSYDKRMTLMEELKQDTDIKDVTFSSGEIVNVSRMSWGREYKGQNIYFECFPVAYNFLTFMDIDIIDGENFSRSDELDSLGTIIFNDYARRNNEMALGDLIPGHVKEIPIKGFCKNFNYRPLQHGISNFAFYVFGKQSWKSLNHLYVKIIPGADIKNTIKHIKSSIVKMSPNTTEDEVDVTFFDDELKVNYSFEQNLSNLITTFTLISIIISLIGVFGMVLFETQYKQKEIAIRKVNGATTKEIIFKFMKKYIYIIISSFVIASPISWIITNRWFNNFTYHIPIYPWVFIIALGLISAITLTLIYVRCLKAANTNPIEYLKNE